MVLKLMSRFLVACLVFCSIGTTSVDAFLFSNPLIDQPAQNFTLYTLAGEKTSLDRAREDNRAIVFFWATWCPYCRGALKQIKPKIASLKESGIELIMVNVGEDKSTVADYINHIDIGDVTVFLDTDGAISSDYLVEGLPTFIFINGQGLVVDVGHELPSDLTQIF